MRKCASRIAWPLLVVGSGLLFHLAYSSGYAAPVAFLAANGAVIGLVLAVEQFLPYRPEWSALTDRQSINDLAHALIENEIGQRLGTFLFLTLATSCAESIVVRVGHPLWSSHWPFLGQVVIATAICDGLDYWKHRLLHTIPSWWRVHALHHGIARLHVFKAARLHFTDLLLRFALVYAPMVALGVPADVLLWYTTFIGVFGAVGHSNIRVNNPWLLHWVFMTPEVHRLHHSIKRADADSNYANIFPLWDVVFGTFTHPATRTVTEVGVVGDPIPEHFLGQFAAPFIWKRLDGAVDV